MRVRHEFACRSLILYHKEPPPTHRSIPESIHIALTTYSPRITQAVVGLARWVVDRWPVWVKVIFRSGQLWLQVVGSAGGRAGTILDGLRALLTVSVRESLLSDARAPLGGRTRTLTDALLVTIYMIVMFLARFFIYTTHMNHQRVKKNSS